MISRRVALLAPFALAACAQDRTPPVRHARGGEEEGGIGGTGIFGTVTALGSLRVNGLTLATWAGTAVESLAQRGEPVQPGDTVAAEAVRDRGRLLATRLAVFHPLVGPLEATAEGGLAVLGTRLLGPVEGMAALRPGMTVAVSGLWRGPAVVPTAIRVLDQAPARQAVLRGQLRRTAEGVVVGGTRLLGQGRQDGIAADRFVTVQGVPQPGGLMVEAIDERPLGVFSGRIAALSVEGFLAPNRLDPGFHLAGFGLALDPGSRIRPRAGERQLFLGRYAEGFRVETDVALPAEPVARAAALAAPDAAAAIGRWLSET